MLKPILIIGIGNPSRGDDALGPLLIERLEALDLPNVELLTDFQLQIEYAYDLQGRQAVIFADASVGGPEPYDFSPVRPEEDTSYSSHVLSPAAVLHGYLTLYGRPPDAHLLAIRGYQFELGEGLTARAAANLDATLDWLAKRLPAIAGKPG
ncbi:MAG TPA: hydrogenase maturation protease [Parasulfuritortus sp.]